MTRSTEDVRSAAEPTGKSDIALAHVEGRDTREHEAVLKSSFDNLGLWATAKRFWKAVLICNLLCIAGGADGYQVTLNGELKENIVERRIR
jgi:hypothetical protein